MREEEKNLSKVELSMLFHEKTYNCAQAVALAYCEELGADRETVFRLTEGFGRGMGNMEQTCGALTGAIFLAGLKNSDANLDAPATKVSTYKLTKEMQRLFAEKCGATVCKDLKGVETGKPLCACDECIRNGVRVAQEVLGLED
jgi:C_GCAxxG_C_C family probable redox protein